MFRMPSLLTEHSGGIAYLTMSGLISDRSSSPFSVLQHTASGLACWSHMLFSGGSAAGDVAFPPPFDAGVADDKVQTGLS